MIIGKGTHLNANSAVNKKILKQRLRIIVTPCSDSFSNSANSGSTKDENCNIVYDGQIYEVNG